MPHSIEPPPRTSPDRIEEIYQEFLAPQVSDPKAIASLVAAAHNAAASGDPEEIAWLAELTAGHAHGRPAIEQAIRRLATAARRANVIDPHSRRETERLLARHHDFIAAINTGADGGKTVVFVAKSPYFMVLRHAIYLRKQGYRTFLLTLYPIPDELHDLFHRNMDGMTSAESSHFVLSALIEAARPAVFHVQCWMLSYEIGRLAIEKSQGSAVVCEFYDVTSIYADRDELCSVWPGEVVDFDFAMEDYILRHASGVISRYPASAMENWGRRFGHLPPYRSLQAYPLPEFMTQNLQKTSRHDGQIRLVYAGGVVPVWLNPALFPEVYMPRTFQRLLEQGLAIDVLHDPYRPVDADPVYAPFLELARRYPHFRLIDGVSPDKLPAVLATYDFGILLCDFPECITISADQKAGVVATKIFAYLEAGLPIIVNAEYLEMARIAEEYGVGMAVHTSQIDRLSQAVRAFDYERSARNVVCFNERFRMDRRVHDLIDLYEEAISRAGAGRATGGQIPAARSGADIPALRRALSALTVDLGSMYADGGADENALRCYRQALCLEPARADLHARIGDLLAKQGAIPQALESYGECLRLDPDRRDVLIRLTASRARYGIRNGAAAARSGLFADSATGPAALPRRRRVRLGLVAGRIDDETREYLLAPFLDMVDHQRFDIYCYGDPTDIQGAVGATGQAPVRWRDTRGRDGEALAAAALQDDLDIALDLAGPCQPAVLAAFAQRLAPTQAQWCAVPMPSGTEAMDCIIADEHLLPPEEEGHFAEKILRIPGTAWAMSPPSAAKAPMPLLDAGYPTLGLIGDLDRLGPAMVAFLSRVLQRAPRSRLVLGFDAARDIALRTRVARSFEDYRIDPSRIAFVERGAAGRGALSPALVDLAVDCFPHASGRHVCGALQVGLPVVTLGRDGGYSGMGRHILDSFGLGWLAPGTLRACHDTILSLIGNADRLAALRQELPWRLADASFGRRERFIEGMEHILMDLYAGSAGSREASTGKSMPVPTRPM